MGGEMDRSFTLAITGDVMLGRLVNETVAARGFAYAWGDVLPVLRKADLSLVNLECALTGHTRPWHDGAYKAFYFRAEPAAVATLKIARVSFASLANNHVWDFGPEGMEETIEVLDREGIAHAGAGTDLAAAQVPARLALDGARVSVVAFADHPPAWAATPTSPGINYTPVSVDADSFADVERAVAAARRDADLVIFSIHWGPNMRSRPTPEFRDFAHRVVEAGADIFWGHSAHLVQGIQIHRGRPILYDTGDFVDDYAVDPHHRNDLSALFLIHASPPAIDRIELLPVKIGRMQVNFAGGRERDWFAQRVVTLCGEMGTGVSVTERGLSIRVQADRGAGERGATGESGTLLRSS
jgi:poly-gamma-glutamate capsule biosynthesis protein CapA/YwtB (metallophosphatase superfamily)